MNEPRPILSPEVDVHQLDGDDTVLCVMVESRGRIVAVVNTAYPEAEAHAAAGFDRLVICGPDCTEV